VTIGIAQFCKSWAARAAAAWPLAAALLIGGSGSAAAAPDSQGQSLVRTYCSGCHHENAGQFERISNLRKTPEGWLMTVFRMRQVHGLVLEEGVRDAIVRHLADTQGLAPSESAAGRFALEQRPNMKDLELGPEIDVMCGRCHSLARVSLQRRDEEEWRKLAHMHLGQWPSLEYQGSGRDRQWFQIATGSMPAQLAALYPYSSSAWTEWQKHRSADLSGTWVVVGHVPGGKDFSGTARIERDAAADYKATYQLTSVDGIASQGESKAVVYTGYEWRGSAQVGDRSLREVYAVSEDGNRIQGRWFDADHAEDGGDWVAVRDDGQPRILAVLPRALRAGTAAEVTIVGIGLQPKSGSVSFGDGTVASNVQRDAHAIRARVMVVADAQPGLRAVSVDGVRSGAALAGGAAGDTLAIYRQIDQIDVLPKFGIARVGGGRIAPVTAQFEAVASTRLPGGELLSIGPVMADWSSAPFDAEAKRTEDEKFTGHFDQRGRFLPGGAGPNPAREFSGDNVGNLTVVARAHDGERAVEGQGHLIVTVQRWNTPPIY
jgi:quinohemoprotein amine dehydrogenase